MPIRVQQIPIGTGVNVYVAPARQSGVIYRNTSGRPMVVMVMQTYAVAGAGDIAHADAYVDAATPPIIAAAMGGIVGPGIVCTLEGTLVFVVPNLFYYRVVNTVSAGGVVGQLNWTEMTLIEPITGGF